MKSDEKSARGQGSKPGPENENLEISSATLLAGKNSVAITHEGSRYTLRLTKQNKLILTK
jgi:hemin uptake protein HemP